MDGPLIAIIAMDTGRNVEFVSPSPGHVKEDNFGVFKKEFMKLG